MRSLPFDRFSMWMWTQQPRFPRCATVPLRGVSCRACCDHGRSLFSVFSVVVPLVGGGIGLYTPTTVRVHPMNPEDAIIHSVIHLNHPFIHPCTYSSIHSFIHLSIHPSIHLFIHPFIRLSIRVKVHGPYPFFGAAGVSPWRCEPLRAGCCGGEGVLGVS